MVTDPVVGLVPVQLLAPDAVHELTLADDQVRVEGLPGTTLLGFAVKFTMGAPGWVTVTVTLPLAAVVPAAPVHVSMYVVVAVGAMTSEPAVALAPVQLAAPAAVQAVALIANQLSVEELPETTMIGLAANVTTGMAGGAPEPPEELELELDPEELDDDELEDPVAPEDPDELDPEELEAPPEELELDELEELLLEELEPEELELEELEPDELPDELEKPFGVEIEVSTLELEPPPEHALSTRLSNAAPNATLIPCTERFSVMYRRLATQCSAESGSIIKLHSDLKGVKGLFP